MKNMLPDSKNISLLWTGGWDSTFQLLQLLIIHKCRVTPFYLIDAERKSTGTEIHTIKCIKDRIFREHPHTQQLLQATRYFAVSDIPMDHEITNAYKSILKDKSMGCQYDWLSRFCKKNLITDIQLCIHCDDKAHSVIEELVLECKNECQTIFRINPIFEETNEYKLFRYFSFPIFQLSKTRMSAIANEYGWSGIMEMTWFCHKPTNKMKPCGKCLPCQFTIEEGLGWRIPLRNRIIYYFIKLLFRPSKTLAKTLLRKLGLLKHLQKRSKQDIALNDNV